MSRLGLSLLAAAILGSVFASLLTFAAIAETILPFIPPRPNDCALAVCSGDDLRWVWVGAACIAGVVLLLSHPRFSE